MDKAEQLDKLEKALAFADANGHPFTGNQMSMLISLWRREDNA